MTTQLAGMGSHERPAGSDDNDWQTPPHIIEALAPFDLDPCASPSRTFDCARNNIELPDDGLRHRWEGFVWLNPPYGKYGHQFLDRLSRHQDGGVALIFARTETAAFQSLVWGRASSLLFLTGRLTFLKNGHPAPGNAGAPSVLVGYGETANARLGASGLNGALVSVWEGVQE